ncbi:pyridoxamine 5'-phosphate oxidase family protein [Halocatena marina]|uniref:pyridoxamine 5'-phosphate oxidase family protein n=1 Tax=Halocatena marina TaxID=2934937 RepID=UPI00200EEC7B|nr:pyridoxamine 5'-phosphate oxidase family protein [Halocatena marina]
MTDQKPTDVQPLGDTTATTPWKKARQQLAESDYYWLTTNRPDKRPHTRPLLAVLTANSLYFSAGPTTRKSKNLVIDSHCSIATETDYFHFVVEGAARKVNDEGMLQNVADAYATKYGWQVDVRDGAVYADGAPTAGPPPYAVYEVAMATVFGFSLDESFTPTRWHFE